MNSSDDYSEPLGEAPDVGGIVGAVRLVDRQTQALKELRAIHLRTYAEERDYAELAEVCTVCCVRWPCPTVDIIERFDA